MLAGIFHQGSGLGDQLHRYITVRTLAEDKGFDWGMVNPSNFKGVSFMGLDTGKPILGSETGFQLKLENRTIENRFEEKVVIENNVDIRSYDPEINFVEDNTIIDGTFEDEKYWGHNLDNINNWLAVKPIHVPDDTCVIGFRGGEYATVPDLYLTPDYWIEAIERMKKHCVRFEVHTDDKPLAESIFKYMDIIQDIGTNWRSVRYAKHAIIANSAFYIMPRQLQHHENKDALTLAPRYWARRNIQTWARPATYYKCFSYL